MEMRLSRRRCCLLAGLLGAGLGGAARAAAWPVLPALMLASDAPPRLDPAGWLVSEKCDGVRARWDGDRLCFRSGRELAAPDWFVETLPDEPLDGELWLGRGRFDALAAALRRAKPVDAEWRALRWMLFDLPAHPGPFAERAAALERLVAEQRLPQLVALPQRRVPDRAALQRWLDEVVAGGGEGLVLQRADALYRAGRSDTLCKLKPQFDADATVLEQLPGHGRLVGRLGGLRVRTTEGRTFVLGSGFSDAERAAPPPVGCVVTYTYRGLTSSGLPRFASFLRVRPADT